MNRVLVTGLGTLATPEALTEAQAASLSAPRLF